jgi:hypothetical protein
MSGMLLPGKNLVLKFLAGTYGDSVGFGEKLVKAKFVIAQINCTSALIYGNNVTGISNPSQKVKLRNLMFKINYA